MRLQRLVNFMSSTSELKFQDVCNKRVRIIIELIAKLCRLLIENQNSTWWGDSLERLGPVIQRQGFEAICVHVLGSSFFRCCTFGLSFISFFSACLQFLWLSSSFLQWLSFLGIAKDILYRSTEVFKPFGLCRCSAQACRGFVVREKNSLIQVRS